MIKPRNSLRLIQSIRQYTSTSYKAPKLGVNTCYDAAVEYLNEYSKKHTTSAETLKEQLKGKAKDKELLKKIEYHLIESKLHLPEIEHQFQNGDIDIHQPVFQHLIQKRWIEHTLPQLKQRLTQMHVIPDVLPPQINLEAELKIAYEESIQPGEKVLVSQVDKQPSVEVTLLHEETKLYTLILTDPDTPDEKTKSYKECVHWMICNLPLNNQTKSIDLKTGDVIAPYLPPHPQQNTKYHRYSMVLLEQLDKIQMDKINQVQSGKPIDTKRFQTIRSLISNFNLEPKAISFFRAKYDDHVTHLYKEVFGLPEPIYGELPTVNPRVDKDGRIRNRYLNA